MNKMTERQEFIKKYISLLNSVYSKKIKDADLLIVFYFLSASKPITPMRGKWLFYLTVFQDLDVSTHTKIYW